MSEISRLGPEHIADDRLPSRGHAVEHEDMAGSGTGEIPVGTDAILALQRRIGNAAVRRLIAARRLEPGGPLPPDLADEIQNLRGKGSPLDLKVRRTMEKRFGADFSNVRIHNDEESHTLAEQLNAVAFTVGNDICFGRGAYRPDSESGRKLLAHELVHVMQQSEAPSGDEMTLGPPGDEYEQEADKLSEILAGRLPDEEEEL